MSAPERETPKVQPSMSDLLASCAAATAVSTPPVFPARVPGEGFEDGQREAAPHRDAA
ncbi:hypothetical protein H9Y04_32790 [Streptomyces sp. TRM66268-LWL]|uniref:Uncharacterized protein n=1 Tax=Streptomyces polyasparticus TaxID=2767826 RepID=A0ABR7SPA0_9ACTN|nr:hypothetical protein [Streptomyces polyasparticus]MBC9717316.1 hypothetical protein [Streptomyces polyasparticus]